jgi:hypothetical protein
MYKLVASDCDNTLLDSCANIPQENIDVIKKLMNKGIKFILATGRNDILVKDYILETGIDAPVIGCNGASIRDLKNDRIIRLTPIPTNSLEKVFEYCREKKIRQKVFTMTHGYTQESAQAGTLGSIFSKYKRVLENDLCYETVENFESLIGKEEIIKVLIVSDDEDFITKTQQDLQQINGVDVVRSNASCIDIGASGVSKGAALKEYARMCGISPSEIVAFGDSENDLSMLEFAGYSVLMKNGDEKLKSKVDFVTDTNDNAGVAKVLERLFADILQ